MKKVYKDKPSQKEIKKQYKDNKEKKHDEEVGILIIVIKIIRYNISLLRNIIISIIYVIYYLRIDIWLIDIWLLINKIL